MNKSGCLAGIVFFLLILIFQVDSYAQKEKSTFRVYQTWITYIGEESIYKGAFYEVKDSSIVLTGTWNKEMIKKDNFTTREHNYKNILEVKTRRSGSIAKGFAIGFGVGFVSGFLVGYARGDDPPCQPQVGFFPVECINHKTAEQKAIGMAIPFSLVFGAIGTGIGAAKVKVSLNGDIKLFIANRPAFQKRSIKK